MTSHVHYVAYGSNLHPLRLQRRVPSAQLIRPIELKGYKLTFHKVGRDRSGKCTIVRTSRTSNVVHAALYRMLESEKPKLDAAEGLGQGYEIRHITFMLGEIEFEAFTYIAMENHLDKCIRPYSWYRDLVLSGARFHGFPDRYLHDIINVESITDQDADRQRSHQALLNEIHQYKPKRV